MTRHTTTTCDGCGLILEKRPYTVTLPGLFAESLDTTLDFCDTDCITTWALRLKGGSKS